MNKVWRLTLTLQLLAAWYHLSDDYWLGVHVHKQQSMQYCALVLKLDRSLGKVWSRGTTRAGLASRAGLAMGLSRRYLNKSINLTCRRVLKTYITAG